MNSSAPSSVLTSGRVLARNTLWNLIGQFAPVCVGVFAIPVLIREIGVERFGVLTFAWLIVGYASLFDMGLGRSLTKIVAEKLGGLEEHTIPPLVWTSLAVLFLLGILGGAIVVLMAPWLVQDALKIPEVLRPETLRALRLLGFSVPLVTSTSGLRGILEAQQRFWVLNAIRIPIGILTFAGPLMVIPFSHSLVPIIMALVGNRLLAGLVHLLACLHGMPALRSPLAFQFHSVAPVLGLGGWLTVSNVLNPILNYMDRFLIGALLSLAAVTYYAAPLEMVTKLSLVPAAAVGVLFPAFALSFVQDRARTSLLLSRGVKFILLVVFPVSLIVVSFAPEVLTLWLGASFAQNSSAVLRWLMVGVFVNCLAQVPFALLQGIGHPQIVVFLILVDLPVYLAVEWWLIKRYGVEGAAAAWALRATTDAVFLFLVVARLVRARDRFIPRLTLTIPVACLVLYLATVPTTLPGKGLFLLIALLAFGLATWFWFLAREERVLLRSPLTIFRQVSDIG